MFSLCQLVGIILKQRFSIGTLRRAPGYRHYARGNTGGGASQNKKASNGVSSADDSIVCRDHIIILNPIVTSY